MPTGPKYLTIHTSKMHFLTFVLCTLLALPYLSMAGFFQLANQGYRFSDGCDINIHEVCGCTDRIKLEKYYNCGQLKGRYELTSTSCDNAKLTLTTTATGFYAILRATDCLSSCTYYGSLYGYDTKFPTDPGSACRTLGKTISEIK